MKLEAELCSRSLGEVERPARHWLLRLLQQGRTVVDEDAIQISSICITALPEMVERHLMQGPRNENRIRSIAVRIDAGKAFEKETCIYKNCGWHGRVRA